MVHLTLFKLLLLQEINYIYDNEINQKLFQIWIQDSQHQTQDKVHRNIRDIVVVAHTWLFSLVSINENSTLLSQTTNYKSKALSLN